MRDGAATGDPPTTGSSLRPRRRRWRRWRARFGRHGFYAASTALVAWAAFVVPLPLIEYVPTDPTPLPELISVEGVATTELDGETAILTVLLRQQPVVPTVGALLDAQRSLRPVHEVYPSGLEREEYLRAQRERFGRQFEIAAAIGAQAAGYEAELVTEVVVIDVLPGSPADGLLERGDVIRAAAGRELVGAEELQEITRQATPGDRLTMTVLRGGEAREVTAVLESFGPERQARLGVAIQTAVDELRLPFEIALAPEVRIGGPSAGLIVAVTVYDLLSEENLLRGRHVVATGSLDADGRVGMVGGVPAKVIAAAEHGADVVLVPALQLDEARQVAPEGLTVIGVGTLDQALDALREDPV